jgi:hypothetical protein
MLLKKARREGVRLSAPLVGRVYAFSGERQGMVCNASMKSMYSA